MTERDGVFTFEVATAADGSWNRPPAALLPRRLKNPEVLEGRAIVTEDFVLLPLSGGFKKGETHRVRFRGR